MDPAKKRRRSEQSTESTVQEMQRDKASPSPDQTFGTETAEDREKELADAELKNLWDATEVIDMDTV
ncbi:MAG: hypothetical protein CV090_04915 [Nitrospira sp. WS238]|nr:hypothetical protein [Nitrospira sp. WS238]